MLFLFRQIIFQYFIYKYQYNNKINYFMIFKVIMFPKYSEKKSFTRFILKDHLNLNNIKPFILIQSLHGPIKGGIPNDKTYLLFPLQKQKIPIVYLH